ncbi:Thyroid hormone-inducible hepatic protein [Varanus komodoensis]|uniref:Mid1-interacting protein 1 n=1 Tax=Varanus komodoensis TaxID=61221 RepID=A0A8D2J8T9_VARKO|nr:thyroid hormone-inducible hepatic protein-like [Varanus komodoensis]KAF7237902.1 Thyroid hormone-inducible hepatic protein [Varanus komodoensis]
MEAYFSAVHKMEQTVMFPSLLLGVSLEDRGSTFEANSCDGDSVDRDLYEYFMLLKSIKQMAESGLVPLEGKNSSMKEEEDREEADLEGLFYYHVSGLQHVLVRLTTRANTVTSKYNEIMGQMNENKISLHW